METIINEIDGEKCIKTSETICNTSSAVTRSSSCYSSSYPRSKKQQRSISDPRKSLGGLSSRINPSKKCHRRSTVVCVPLSDRKQENEIIFRVPYKDIEEDNYFRKRISHDSIALIKENSSYPIDEPKEHFYYSNSDSDEQQYYQKGTTRIKLSLPMTSPRHRYQTHIRGGGSDGTIIESSSLAGEFTLPTNPPITVTIEPQSNTNNNNIERDNSLHVDQICPPEHVNIREQRLSVDPALKGASSTVVSYFMDLLKPSDNKLAMKLFGSRKGVLKERLRQQRAGHCIIHPCSNFRLIKNIY
jgi:hypothetical protein